MANITHGFAVPSTGTTEQHYSTQGTTIPLETFESSCANK